MRQNSSLKLSSGSRPPPLYSAVICTNLELVSCGPRCRLDELPWSRSLLILPAASHCGGRKAEHSFPAFLATRDASMTQFCKWGIQGMSAGRKRKLRKTFIFLIKREDVTSGTIPHSSCLEHMWWLEWQWLSYYEQKAERSTKTWALI